MSALLISGPQRRPKPLCADDDADVDVDARNVLSNFTILPLPRRVIWMQTSPFWLGFELRVPRRDASRSPAPLLRGGLQSRTVSENADRPRPDQQRRSVLPAGVPSTSSTGNPRRARRDKAQHRGSASACDPSYADAETDQRGALCTLGNPITRAARTSPQHLGAASVCCVRCHSTAPPNLVARSGARRPCGCRKPRFRVDDLRCR
jgi:hypothetical protein